jgi:hypothetical protein
MVKMKIVLNPDSQFKVGYVLCASCGEWLLMNSEDLINTTCQLCKGEAD